MRRARFFANAAPSVALRIDPQFFRPLEASMASRNRGRKKSTIRLVSHEPPTEEEIDHISSNLATMPDVAAALLDLAMIEHELEYLLRQRFARKDETTWFLLVAENGPLSTFAMKITAGYSFPLFDETTKKNLSIV